MFEHAASTFNGGPSPPPTTSKIVSRIQRQQLSAHAAAHAAAYAAGDSDDSAAAAAAAAATGARAGGSSGGRRAGGDDASSLQLTLGHVVHALGFRRLQIPVHPPTGSSTASKASKVLGLERRRDWAPQPFQAQWLMLIEARCADAKTWMRGAAVMLSLRMGATVFP